MNWKACAPLAMVVGATLLQPGTARADNTTAANADTLLLGQVQEGTITAGGILNRWYKVNLVAGRSYCAMSWAPFTDPTEAPVDQLLDWFLNDGTTPAPGQTFRDMEPSTTSNAHLTEQGMITPTTNGVFRLRVRHGPQANPATTFKFDVVVMETTIFSPWYFVSAGDGYDGFIEVKNTTRQSVTITVTVYASAGTVVGTPRTEILPANGNTVVAISGNFPISSGFGSVQISHDGTPGALVANITTLSAATGLSFDAPFTPRMTWGTMGPAIP